MIVEIVKKDLMELEEYWVVRGIKDTGIKKEVVAEQEFDKEPSPYMVAQFLIDNPKAAFCSVGHNYRIKEVELPFK